jgi:starch-binding outer membrane protein, SusD/RagB family
MLLAKLYLNAEVYTGTAKYSEALTYTKKVIDEGGYTLSPNFESNFSGDNNTSNEIIYPLIADPLVSQSYGNTTYIVNGSLSSATMTLSSYGATDGWAGHRATKAWYGLFGDLATSTDDRADLFWTTGHTYEMTDYKQWTDGYPSIKFRNSNFAGTSTPTGFSGTDFPLFRLADAYLMFAECVVRGATGGTMNEAKNYVNDVRTRSNASLITESDLTLNFLIDERARELNLEGHRRTDLIRFGKFTGGSYLWPWKGNTLNGASIPSTYKLFPIPVQALQANSNLTQNPGY